MNNIPDICDYCGSEALGQSLIGIVCLDCLFKEYDKIINKSINDTIINKIDNNNKLNNNNNNNTIINKLNNNNNTIINTIINTVDNSTIINKLNNNNTIINKSELPGSSELFLVTEIYNTKNKPKKRIKYKNNKYENI